LALYSSFFSIPHLLSKKSQDIFQLHLYELKERMSLTKRVTRRVNVRQEMSPPTGGEKCEKEEEKKKKKGELTTEK
jgi:hypothetical protein